MKRKNILCALALFTAGELTAQDLPQLGRAPIEEVIAAMTLEEKSTCW